MAERYRMKRDLHSILYSKKLYFYRKRIIPHLCIFFVLYTLFFSSIPLTSGVETVAPAEEDVPTLSKGTSPQFNQENEEQENNNAAPPPADEDEGNNRDLPEGESGDDSDDGSDDGDGDGDDDGGTSGGLNDGLQIDGGESQSETYDANGDTFVGEIDLNELDGVLEYEGDINFDSDSDEDGGGSASGFNLDGASSCSLFTLESTSTYMYYQVAGILQNYLFQNGEEFDNSAPEISLIYPFDQSIIYHRRPCIHLSVSDENGLNPLSLNVRLDGQNIKQYATIVTNDIYYTPSFDLAVSPHTIFISVMDIFGNTASEEFSFSVEEILISEEVHLGNTTENQDSNASLLLGNETGICGVSLTPAVNLTNVTVSVSYLPAFPDNIPSPPGVVYKILDLKLLSNGQYVTEYNIEKLWFEYKVLIKWMLKNKVNNESIRLMRYHNGSWQNLTFTEITDIDIVYLYFFSETPGCSTFAIVGSKAVEIKQYQSQMPEISWAFIIGTIVITNVAIVLVLFKAGYIYPNQNQGKNKKSKTIKKSGIIAGFFSFLIKW